MRKTLRLVPILAVTLLTVSACAKHDAATNTTVANDASVNAAGLDSNSGTVDSFGNATQTGTETAPPGSGDTTGNAGNAF